MPGFLDTTINRLPIGRRATSERGAARFVALPAEMAGLLAQAQLNELLSLVQLYNALGGGWQSAGGTQS